jgi:suppressor of G2 allele of SKP1
MAISLARQLIAEGDASFVDEDYTASVESYSRALSAIEEENVAAGEDHRDNNADRIEALSHRSAANLKLKKFEAALVDSASALQLLHTSPVGTNSAQTSIILESRHCEALFHLGRFGQAQQRIDIIFDTLPSGTNKEIDNSVCCQKHLAKLSRILDQCPQNELEDLDDNIMTHARATDSIASSGNGTESEPKPAPHANASSSGSDAVPAKTAPIFVKRSNKPVSKVPKYQYYQSDTFVTISILEAGLTAEALKVEFEPTHLTVILHKDGTDFTIICGTLFDEINPDKCRINYKDEKVLLKLRKTQEGMTWHELFGKGGDNKETKKTSKQNAKKSVTNDTMPPSTATNADANTTGDKATANAGSEAETTAKASSVATLNKKKTDTAATPYASNRDWNAIERELEAQEEEPEGDEALNNLFKQIYGDANEDTRRAMIKSFQTSGGTVLSTNWDDVGKTDYEKERQAPKGMEWKNWEGAKLPQKED